MITRDVAVGAVDDLALRPPRAALAATVDDEIVVYPVRVTLEAPAEPGSSARIVQVPQDCPDLSGCNAVVIADDGPQWFRLRALTIRGTAVALADRTYRIPPAKIVAWDYGRLREAPTPPATAAPRETSFSVIDDNHGAHPALPPNLQAAVGRSRVMILASRSPKGTPFAVPLWFVAHRGRIYSTTAASSWTVRNVVSCPQVALLLGGERDDNTAARLLVRGSARARRYMPPPAVLARIAWRYYGQPRFAMVELQHIRLWARRMRYYRQAQAAHIVITPETATECQVPPP